MASYVNEGDAGFRMTGISGLGTILGPVQAVIEKIIQREPLKADPNNYPASRPVDVIDARATVDFLDPTSALSESTAAANLVFAFTSGDGGAGSVTVGKMVAGSVTYTMARNQGGYRMQQVFELEGALTFTATV